MPYAIAVSDDGKYIVITVEGDVTRRNAMEWVLEAHALGCKAGIHRYLVDVTQARNTDPVIENYDFAYQDAKSQPMDKAARVAALAAPDDHSHDFVATAIGNAGGSFNLFRNRAQAMAYLLSDDDHGHGASPAQIAHLAGPAD
jgi:hypothetical protein